MSVKTPTVWEKNNSQDEMRGRSENKNVSGFLLFFCFFCKSTAYMTYSNARHHRALHRSSLVTEGRQSQEKKKDFLMKL